MTTSDRGEDHGSVTDADGDIQAEYDWSSVTPSTAVIETVAIATNREPTALEPLYKSVDVDALDALLASDGFHSTGRVTTVSFAFAGHDVTVQNNGVVVVQPTESRHESE
jgi:hypothetical protein